MNKLPNSTQSDIVETLSPMTGVPTDPISQPSIAVYLQGSLVSPTVTWTHVGTGLWSYSYTVPNAAGYTVREIITATMTTFSGNQNFSTSRVYDIQASGSGGGSGSGSGSGSGIVTVTVTGTNGVNVQNATVSVYDGSYNVMATGVTGSNGQIVLAAPAGTYTVAAYASGYKSSTQTATLASGANTVSISLTANSVSESIVPGVSNCYGYLMGSSGPIENESITITMTAAPAGGGGLSNEPITMVSDSTGTLNYTAPGGQITNYVPLFVGATYSVVWGANPAVVFVVQNVPVQGLPAFVGGS